MAVLAAGFLLLAAMYLFSATVYVSGIRFQFDDWEWLWWGQRADRFLELMTTNREMIRPVPWALYAVFQWLFGLQPVAMGLFFLGVSVAASVLLVQVFRAVGFPAPVAVFAALLAWSSGATTTSLAMLSLNETTIARALAALLWLLFLSHKEPSVRRWSPVLVVGLLCHEQFLMAPAMLTLLFWYRDGWAGLRERWAQSRAFRSLWWATTLFGGMRIALFVFADRTTHELDAQALGRNLSYFAGHLGMLPLSGVREAESWTWFVAVLFLVLAWLLSRGVRAGSAPGRRMVVFLAGWVVLACAPFLFSRDYVAIYFLNLAVYASALAFGTLLVGAVSDLRVSARVRLLLVAVALVVLPRQLDLKPSTKTASRILAAVHPQIGPGASETPVVFVEDTPSLTARDEPYLRREGIAPYLATISAEWRNHALEVLHPGRSFPVAVLEEDEAWLLCARPDDVLVYVEALPRFHSRWHFSSLRVSSPLHGGLPPAVIRGLPAHALTLHDLQHGSSHPAAQQLAGSVLSDYARFCHARLAGDVAEGARAALRVVESASLLNTPMAEDLLAALEAVWSPPPVLEHRPRG